MRFHQLISGNGQIPGSVLDPLDSIGMREAAGDLHDGIELPGSFLNPGGEFQDIQKQRAASLLFRRWRLTPGFP